MIRSSLLASVPGIVHGFSSRVGGVSIGAFTSLNLSSRVGDDRDAVQENRHRLLAELGRADAQLVTMKQIHGDSVHEVSHRAGRSIEGDGLWTRDALAMLAVLVADCVPILVGHPGHPVAGLTGAKAGAAASGPVVAAVHAGWRGTQTRIAARMVERLAAAGFAAAGLRVALGPAIGPCCFNIGADVAEALRIAVPETTEAVRTSGDRTVADLWELNRRILIAAGVAEASIEVIPECTSCSSSFFSHRRDKTITGRQAGVIGLVEKPRIS